MLTLAAQPDGKVLIGGAFDKIGTQAHSPLARLNPDGSLDASFTDPGAFLDTTSGSSWVHALTVQADGNAVIGGDFVKIGSTTRTLAARLSTDGSLDANLADLAPDGAVNALAAQADGKMFVGGYFTRIGGQSRHGAARVNASGGIDASFADPGLDDSVNALAVQADGKLLVGGTFTKAGAQTRNGIARLNADGSLDVGFLDTSANYQVLALAVQTDGKILAGGGFSQIGGQPRNSLARLNADGSLDAGFADIAAAGGVVYALAAQGDSKLVIGGNFTRIQSQTRNALARLAVPDAALQSLDVQGDAAIWNRSGASPELALPPILYASADCVAYTALGPMARIADGWRRSGVTLPVGWSCLRTEGRTSGGISNASQGLVESVRRVWRDDRLFANGFE